jgi:hypothetical protein
MTHKRIFRTTFLALAAAAALQPLAASAQAAPGPWKWRASIYGYIPSLDVNTSAPAGGTSIDISGDKIIDNINGFFMGSLEAHNGRWGVYTDYMHLSLGNTKRGSRDFTIGGTLPAGTTADLGYDLKGSIWTLAGEWRLPSDPAMTMDALAGVRMFDLKTSLRWDIAGALGSLPPASRTGSSGHDETLWDVVVGVKGRYAFGADQRWTLPYYLDIGTGNSSLTWQAAAGVGYSFSWGELSLLYRHLAYDMKSGSPVKDLTFSGPMFGATFTF